VVFAALALPGSALPQALILDTNGQTGDGSHSVAPVAVSQGNDDATASADAGSGSGSAATAGTQGGDDGGTASVGCANGAGTAGDSELDGSAGNCGSGGGGAAASTRPAVAETREVTHRKGPVSGALFVLTS
jgi:hypothetical protein